MKKITISILSFLFVSLQLQAQNKVEKLTVMGNTYTVTKVFPEEIIGEYT